MLDCLAVVTGAVVAGGFVETVSTVEAGLSVTCPENVPNFSALIPLPDGDSLWALASGERVAAVWPTFSGEVLRPLPFLALST